MFGRKLMAFSAAMIVICASVLAGGPAQAGESTVVDRQSLAASDGPYYIVNSHSGKCLVVKDASTADNVPAIQWTCDTTPPFNERWYFDGSHIVNMHSGKCLVVKNASTTDNVPAIQWTCDTTPPFNENWFAVSVVHVPAIHIVNSHSGKCLAIKNVGIGNGDLAVQYTCDFAFPFNEEWYLVAA